MKVINATSKFQKHPVIIPNQRVVFCVEANSKNEHLDNSQLIALYDLDNDGIIRIGFPGNPVNNMFFSRINEVEFNDINTIERLKREGKKGVQIKYYHAFNNIKDVNDREDVIKVIMDCDTHIVTSVSPLHVDTNNYNVASKQKNG